jgi:hypothetical protein
MPLKEDSNDSFEMLLTNKCVQLDTGSLRAFLPNALLETECHHWY